MRGEMGLLLFDKFTLQKYNFNDILEKVSHALIVRGFISAYSLTQRNRQTQGKEVFICVLMN